MNNAPLLAQARRMIKGLIDESPQVVIIYRDLMVDDGFGNQVVDPFHVGEPCSVRGRISHEKRAVEDNVASGFGLSTDLQRYFLVEHTTTINEKESFSAMGKRWRIGPVDVLVKFGGVTGYQAPLIEAAEVPEAET